MNAKKTLFGLLIFAFITRLLMLISFPLHYTDYYLINVAAQNLVDGHGMGFIKSDINDLSQFYFEGLRLWPPLVPFITAVGLKLTGSIPITDIAITVLLLLLLFIYVHNLLKLLAVSVHLQILGYLFIATNPELIKQPGFSDLAAATFCLGACACCYQLITKSTKKTYGSSLLYAFFFFLPSAFRYQYYPVSLFFPLAVIGVGFVLKDIHFKKQGLLLLFFVSILLIVQEFFLYNYSSQPLTQSVAMDKRGFFLSNLSFIYPFFLKTFVNFSYLENKYNELIHQFTNLYSVVFVVLFLGWFVALIRLIKQKYAATTNSTQHKSYLSVFVLLLILLIPPLVLTLLSLLYNSRSGVPGGWTYVREGRYYIVSSILVLVLTLWYFQERLIYFSKIAKATLTILLTTIILYNIVLTGKFYYNVAVHNIPDKEINNRSDRMNIEQEIHQLSATGVPTVICSDEPYFAYYPFTPNVAITAKTTELVTAKLKTSRSLYILIIAQKPLSGNDAILIKQTNAKQIKSLHTSTLYLTTLVPSTDQ